MGCAALSLPRLERLMVTRPAAEAERWVQALSAAGWPAESLPLIDIREPSERSSQAALVQARTHWPQWDALMFVSSAAVTHFFAGDCAPAPAECRTRFWAPGPGTGRALVAALKGLGLTADSLDMPGADSAQFDSEALWPVVRGQMAAGKRVLVVRGAACSTLKSGTETGATEPEAALPGLGREWLIGQCRALGAEVQACVAYERCAPTWNAALCAQAASGATANTLWLFSSSEALWHLREGLPEADWGSCAALVTHPRIAKTAQDTGFVRVQMARPALPDVLRALESQWSPP